MTAPAALAPLSNDDRLAVLENLIRGELLGMMDLNELDVEGGAASAKAIDEIEREIAETDFDSFAGLATKMHAAARDYSVFWDVIEFPSMPAVKGLGECLVPWLASQLSPYYREQWEAVFGRVAVDRQPKAA